MGITGPPEEVGMARLIVCKRIVKRHSGRIWVESEVGNGSHLLFHDSGGKKTGSGIALTRSNGCDDQSTER